MEKREKERAVKSKIVSRQILNKRRERERSKMIMITIIIIII